MDRILGGIYVGSYQPVAVGVDLKGKHKITHVLSVITGELPEQLSKNYNVKQISVDDKDSENIIDFFKEANEFIDNALFPPVSRAEKEEQLKQQQNEQATSAEAKKKNGHRGAILIHCSEGVSRSVAFTVAYLMYKYKLSLQNALYAVQRRRDFAQPNEGFMEQLRIYEEALKHMEYRYKAIDLNAEHSYREWIFKNHMEDEESRNKFLMNDKSYADIELKPKQDASVDAQNKDEVENNVNGQDGSTTGEVTKEGKITQLRCKKCRQPLALSTSFIPHERPEQASRHAQFITTSANSNRIIGIERASDFCSHIFTEPLNWMKEELQGKGELLGKFYCPNTKCGTKVGTYSWKGSRCSCGKWVVPAISFSTAKVDEAYITTNTNFEQVKHDARSMKV